MSTWVDRRLGFIHEVHTHHITEAKSVYRNTALRGFAGLNECTKDQARSKGFDDKRGEIAWSAWSGWDRAQIESFLPLSLLRLPRSLMVDKQTDLRECRLGGEDGCVGAAGRSGRGHSPCVPSARSLV